MVFRAFPEDARPIGDNDDYGAQIGLGIEAYYGHGMRKDKLRGKAPSAVILKAYSANPGTI